MQTTGKAEQVMWDIGRQKKTSDNILVKMLTWIK